MKKFICLIFAVCCGIAAAAAQDLIVKTDASKIEASVLEVSPDAVRYKRFSNPDGPTYVLPVAEIHYIQYANGEKEFYSEAPATTPETTAPRSEVQTPQGRYVLKEYEIGELYDENGLKGVVCVLSEDKQHGLIISLDQIYLPWNISRKPDLFVVGAENRTDGMANMEIVERYIAEHGLSWDDFPAFKWCREKGEGWYLPSIDEMLNIGHNYNGGVRTLNNRKARNKFNNALKDAGGKRMDKMVYYFSSTEKNEKEAYTSHMSPEPPYIVEIPKYNKFLVRAVHKF